MANLMIVLDGLEDHTYPSLQDLTPYDKGKGKNLTYIQTHAATGRLATTPAGFEPDTQTCILTLLGVQPQDIPGGRSYIEACAVGMPVDTDDLVMRCNFVKIAPDGTIEDPTCHAPADVAQALLAEVAALADVRIQQVGTYKSLQCVAGGGASMDTMKTYPPHNYAGQPMENLLPSGNALAERLAQFSREMLGKYAPYTVFNWGQAVPCTLPSFSSLHDGMTGGMVSATDAPVGGAIVMGMECIRPETATGDVDTDLTAKAQATLSLLQRHAFVMLHIGGPDEATHRKNEREKAECVRRIDAELIGPILEGCPQGTKIMVTCDHMALCSTSGHTADPVAFQLFEKGQKRSGDMGCIAGTKAIDLLHG